VKNDESVIGGFMDITFDTVDAEFDRRAKGLDRIIRVVFSKAAVCDIQSLHNFILTLMKEPGNRIKGRGE
jgi:hypothetical protein